MTITFKHTLLILLILSPLYTQTTKFTLLKTEIGECSGKKVEYTSKKILFCLEDTQITSIKEGKANILSGIKSIKAFTCDRQHQNSCIIAADNTKYYLKADISGTLKILDEYTTKVFVPETSTIGKFTKAVWVDFTDYVLMGSTLNNGIFRLENTPVENSSTNQYFGYVKLSNAQDELEISDILMIENSPFFVVGARKQANVTSVDVTSMAVAQNKVVAKESETENFEKYFSAVDFGNIIKHFVIASQDLRLIKLENMSVEAIVSKDTIKNFLAVTAYQQSDIIIALSKEYLGFFQAVQTRFASQAQFTVLLEEDFSGNSLLNVEYSLQGKELLLLDENKKVFSLDVKFKSETERYCHRNCMADCQFSFNFRFLSDCPNCNKITSSLVSEDVYFCFDSKYHNSVSFNQKRRIYSFNRNSVEKKIEEIANQKEETTLMKKIVLVVILILGLILCASVILFGIVNIFFHFFLDFHQSEFQKNEGEG